MITSPLFGWFAGTELLPRRFHSEDDEEIDGLETSWAVSVSLDEVVPLHQAVQVNWQSLRNSRELTAVYLTAADRLIDGLWGGRLDSEECSMIRNALGVPPEFCMPIYMMTIHDADVEEVVYVGKTISSSRFVGGHAAALKLHSPEFSQFSKRIYRCSVLLYMREEYLALEWLDSDRVAENVLDLTETLLIYALQPKLNSAKRRRPLVANPMHIHVQNYAGTGLLNDLMLEYSNEQGLRVIPSKGSLAGGLGTFRTEN